MIGTAQKIDGARFRLLRHRGRLCLPAAAGHGLAEGGRALLTDLCRRYPRRNYRLSRVEVSARHGKMVEKKGVGNEKS